MGQPPLAEHVAPVEDVTWVAADGLRHHTPEVALLFKAKHAREKDEADLSAALPLLDAAQRAWLRQALQAVHPGHAWIERVSP